MKPEDPSTDVAQEAFVDERPESPEDAEVLRRMIRSIEHDKDRTHLVFIKVLGGNSRVYKVGPVDKADLAHLKNLLLPVESSESSHAASR